MSNEIRVLIVDDSKDDALLVLDELASNGYDVTHAQVESAASLRAELAGRVWDIVICDYTMPDFNGREALELLHETGQDIPFILVSGKAPDRTGIEMMRAGARDYIMKDDLSRLAAVVAREIQESEGRRHRRRAERALREAELHRLEFYRRTIAAATEGRLLICEPDEIKTMAGEPIAEWQISSYDDLRQMQDDVHRIASQEGMPESRVPYLLSCVVEAGANAIKHAKGGSASLHRAEGAFLVVFSDAGPGIGALALPDVALTKGYSTAGTLGMGYKVMLDAARRIYLSTGPDGTTMAAEVAMAENEERRVLLERLSGWPED